MKVRPYSAADLLRQNSPRKFLNASSRFASLRDESPAPGNDSSRRFRSPSVKRKPDEPISYSSMVSKSLPSNSTPLIDPQTVEQVGINTAKVTSLIDKVKSELVSTGALPEIINIFSDICEAIKCVNDSQQLLISSKNGSAQFQPGAHPAPPKKVKQNSQSSSQAPVLVDISLSHSQPPPQPEVAETQEEARRRKFKESVKEAERSTLIFNLDMGKVPLMNQETISKKATLALASMAVKNEGKSTSTPSEEAVAAIDDILSITTGMTIFGKTTKSYANKKDSSSGSFCTIPVKYSFKDKDTRIRAEAALRSSCKVSCSTPYPVILRECIKQVVNAVKEKYPGEFVRTNVDPAKLTLSVARRGNKDAEWQYLRKPVILPLDVLNIDARRVPDGFRLSDLPDGLVSYTPTKPDRGRQGRKPSIMEFSNE